ncbi:MAG: RNA polymerase sigma-70 factor [Balneolaceae bacterium]|nr:RNA polymerase sigma-70 factor [Balneolaceae bacterium]
MDLKSESDFDESECVRSLNEADRTAFKKLFTKYYEQLCRFVYRYVKSESISESLVQEVFVRVWEQKEQLDAQKNIRSYLYKSARNEALDYIQHKDIVKEKLSLLKGDQKPARTTDDVLDKEKFWTFVQHQIEQLPPKTQLVYKLSRKDGLTYIEIAELLEVSPKTVRIPHHESTRSTAQRAEYKAPFPLHIISL